MHAACDTTRIGHGASRRPRRPSTPARYGIRRNASTRPLPHGAHGRSGSRPCARLCPIPTQRSAHRDTTRTIGSTTCPCGGRGRSRSSRGRVIPSRRGRSDRRPSRPPAGGERGSCRTRCGASCAPRWREATGRRGIARSPHGWPRTRGQHGTCCRPGACPRWCPPAPRAGPSGGTSRRPPKAPSVGSEPCDRCRRRCAPGPRSTTHPAALGRGSARSRGRCGARPASPCAVDGTSCTRRCCRGSSSSTRRVQAPPGRTASCACPRACRRDRCGIGSTAPSRPWCLSPRSRGTTSMADPSCPLRASARSRGTSGNDRLWATGHASWNRGTTRSPRCACRARRGLRYPRPVACFPTRRSGTLCSAPR